MRLAFAALAAFILASPALADPAPGTPTLSANGEAEVMATPDIAIVTIGVTSRAKTAAEALAANSADVAKVLATLKDAAIADKDIGTTNFSVYPLYDQRPDREGAPNNPPPIVGYSVSNDVRVTIRDIGTSGAILDKVVTAGANRISGIAFDVSDRQTPSDQAIKDAIAEARRKGALMADAAGVKLVRIVSVSASANGGPQPVFARMEMKAAAVPVMPGQRSIGANASIVWEVAPL
jgi:hypothetical protein